MVLKWRIRTHSNLNTLIVLQVLSATFQCVNRSCLAIYFCNFIILNFEVAFEYQIWLISGLQSRGRKMNFNTSKSKNKVSNTCVSGFSIKTHNHSKHKGKKDNLNNLQWTLWNARVRKYEVSSKMFVMKDQL